MPAPTSGQPTSGFPTSAFSANQQANPYVVYELDQEYQYNDGSLAIPIGASPTSPGQRPARKIVNVAAPYSRRIVTFAVARLNALPLVPSPAPLNSNENLTSVKVKTSAPKLWSDGVSRVYAVAGEYVFDHRQAVLPGTDALKMGATDVDSTNPISYVFDSPQFKPMI
jgi:hypothetical protein